VNLKKVWGVYHRIGSFHGHPKNYPVEKYIPAYKRADVKNYNKIRLL